MVPTKAKQTKESTSQRCKRNRKVGRWGLEAVSTNVSTCSRLQQQIYSGHFKNVFCCTKYSTKPSDNKEVNLKISAIYKKEKEITYPRLSIHPFLPLTILTTIAIYTTIHWNMYRNMQLFYFTHPCMHLYFGGLLWFLLKMRKLSEICYHRILFYFAFLLHCYPQYVLVTGLRSDFGVFISL